MRPIRHVAVRNAALPRRGAVVATPSSARCVHSVSVDVADKLLTLESGRIGPLADSVVFAKYGNTSMLVSVVSARHMVEDDFLPLQVDYRERAFARGLIPTTPTKKEAATTDRETLGARVIDRTLRPLFPDGYFYDTQLIATVLSVDPDADAGMLGVIASSAALHASDIPFHGPAAAVLVGIDSTTHRPVIAPPKAALSVMRLLYAGSEGRCLMIEAEGSEAPEAAVIAAMRAGRDALRPLLELQHRLADATQRTKRRVPLMLPSQAVCKAAEDAIFLEAKDVLSGARSVKADRSAMQGRLTGKAVRAVMEKLPAESKRAISIAVSAVIRQAFREVVTESAGVMHTSNAGIMHASNAGIMPSHPAAAPLVVTAAGEEEGAVASLGGVSVEGSAATGVEVGAEALRYRVFDAPAGRVDGRGTTALRVLTGQVDVLPLVHGSALFSRGSTQVLSAATLGPLNSTQMLNRGSYGFGPGGGEASPGEGEGGGGGGGEGSTISAPTPVLDDEESKSFFLHYDFPPYSTNEIGKLGINRRSVGHGALAEKAIAAVMPSPDAFPYTVRVLAETTGSDGSSSMATVCSATLALMDAGVPIRTPVAGISIGAITTADAPGGMRDGDGYVLLTDIYGLEDHTGDMDFKVAGSKDGVTAIQLDVKPAGIPLEVLEAALWRAKEARTRILAVMADAMAAPRAELKPSAPRVEVLLVPPELRMRLVGPGGANLRRIEQMSCAQMVLDEDINSGTGASRLFIYGSGTALVAARTLIDSAVQEHLRVTGSPLTLTLVSPSVRATFPQLVVGVPVTLLVSKTNEFGAVLGDPHTGREAGWLHVSELTRARHHKVSDYLLEGDEVTVQVCDVDARGRGRLSVKALLKPGEDVFRHIRRKGRTAVGLVVEAPAASPGGGGASAPAAPAPGPSPAHAGSGRAAGSGDGPSARTGDAGGPSKGRAREVPRRGPPSSPALSPPSRSVVEGAQPSSPAALKRIEESMQQEIKSLLGGAGVPVPSSSSRGPSTLPVGSVPLGGVLDAAASLSSSAYSFVVSGIKAGAARQQQRAGGGAAKGAGGAGALVARSAAAGAPQPGRGGRAGTEGSKPSSTPATLLKEVVAGVTIVDASSAATPPLTPLPGAGKPDKFDRGVSLPPRGTVVPSARVVWIGPGEGMVHIEFSHGGRTGLRGSVNRLEDTTNRTSFKAWSSSVKVGDVVPVTISSAARARGKVVGLYATPITTGAAGAGRADPAVQEGEAAGRSAVLATMQGEEAGAASDPATTTTMTTATSGQAERGTLVGVDSAGGVPPTAPHSAQPLPFASGAVLPVSIVELQDGGAVGEYAHPTDGGATRVSITKTTLSGAPHAFYPPGLRVGDTLVVTVKGAPNARRPLHLAVAASPRMVAAAKLRTGVGQPSAPAAGASGVVESSSPSPPPVAVEGSASEELAPPVPAQDTLPAPSPAALPAKEKKKRGPGKKKVAPVAAGGSEVGLAGDAPLETAAAPPHDPATTTDVPSVEGVGPAKPARKPRAPRKPKAAPGAASAGVAEAVPEAGARVSGE